jgi:hypothetical protein
MQSSQKPPVSASARFQPTPEPDDDANANLGDLFPSSINSRNYPFAIYRHNTSQVEHDCFPFMSANGLRGG